MDNISLIEFVVILVGVAVVHFLAGRDWEVRSWKREEKKRHPEGVVDVRDAKEILWSYHLSMHPLGLEEERERMRAMQNSEPRHEGVQNVGWPKYGSALAQSEKASDFMTEMERIWQKHYKAVYGDLADDEKPN